MLIAEHGDHLMTHLSFVRASGVLAVSAAIFSLAVGRGYAGDDQLRDEAKSLFGTIEAPAEDSLADADVVLGRALFWDTRISADGKTACATCHMPEDHAADRRQFSPDARGKTTSRNSQTVFNATLQPSLRWTGNRKSGTEQAEKSLTGSLGLASADAAVELLKELGYEAAFRKAFPDDTQPVSAGNFGRAVEAYEDTLVTPAPFDKFLAGAGDALTDRQKSGLATFIEAGCADCHSGPLLGGGSLEKFGAVKDYWTATGSEKVDLGRFEDTKNDDDKYVFRVSMLRNIAKTAPYFHDGSVAELSDAVQIMADVQLGAKLSAADKASIVEFLQSLTGEVPPNYAPPEKSADETP
jgi:cytochrome c peroxidase